jgi:predicted CxxxxCH...CXXCH cytochrome family protein
MMPAVWRASFTAALAVILCSCFGEPMPKGVGCNECHGNGESIAPPLGLGDFTSMEYIGVGAHRAHLNATKFSKKVACEECHIVPSTIDDPGHIDTSTHAELKWGPLSKTGTVTPKWDRAAASCRTVYCHGASLGGGTNTVPVWTMVDGTQVGCGSCHSTPPPPPHPTASNCGMCHSPTAGDGAVIASVETHIDGIVQIAAPPDPGPTPMPTNPCGGCHGDSTNLAPNLGAHRAHTSGGRLSNAVMCDTCHVVPMTVQDPGHIDGAPAEIRFEGLAARNGAQPTYAGGSCAMTYCHSGYAGGSVPAPSWNVTDGSQAACGACHGLPPPSPHPGAAGSCSCHSSVAGAGLTIRDPSKHVNGTVNF